jgi:hypothetical protein
MVVPPSPAGATLRHAPLDTVGRSRIVRWVLAAVHDPPVAAPSIGLEVRPAARAAPLLGEQALDRRGRVDDTPAGSADDGWHGVIDRSRGR